MALNNFSIFGGILSTRKKGDNDKPNSTDLALHFLKPLICKPMSMLIIEVYMKKDLEGLVQLSYTSTSEFSDQKSISQYLPQGAIRLNFGFNSESAISYIRFCPLASTGVTEIYDINSYCII